MQFPITSIFSATILLSSPAASMPAPFTALRAVPTFAITELPNDVTHLDTDQRKEERGGFTGERQ